MNLPKTELTKKAPNGEPLKYFNECMKLDTDDCIEWKYGVTAGYGIVWFEGKSIRANRLSLIQTVGEPPKGRPFALHSCHNRACFNSRHLRWGSHTDNMRDKVKDGTSDRGENSYKSKLTEKQVLDIRKDTRPNQEIANDYGASRQTIYKIKTGNTWAWLTNNLINKGTN